MVTDAELIGTSIKVLLIAAELSGVLVGVAIIEVTCMLDGVVVELIDMSVKVLLIDAGFAGVYSSWSSGH